LSYFKFAGLTVDNWQLLFLSLHNVMVEKAQFVFLLATCAVQLPAIDLGHIVLIVISVRLKVEQ